MKVKIKQINNYKLRKIHIAYLNDIMLIIINHYVNFLHNNFVYIIYVVNMSYNFT